MRVLLLSIVFIILIACVPPQAPKQVEPKQNQTASTQEKEVETTKTVVNNTLVDLAVPTSCIDSDGENTKVRGEVVVRYSDGAKETLDDKCDRETGFEIEYYCDGVNAKTRINRCTNSCVKGACT